MIAPPRRADDKPKDEHGAVAVMVALVAWLLRPGGGPSPAKPNAWVPAAGSVEWMRIERARPGTTPLTDLNSLNPGARPVMAQQISNRSG